VAEQTDIYTKNEVWLGMKCKHIDLNQKVDGIKGDTYFKKSLKSDEYSKAIIKRCRKISKLERGLCKLK
jgi:hypothetical protein